MKTRYGYVSNSSTSSFCIVGVEYRKDKFKINDDDSEIFETIDAFFNSAHDFSYNFDANNYLERTIFPLEVCYDQGDNVEAIGIPVVKMESWETKEKFFERAFNALKEIGYQGDLKNIDFISGSYRI